MRVAQAAALRGVASPHGPGCCRHLERIAELEAALRKIADGEIDEGGHRRNYSHATAEARRALGLPK